MLTTLRIVSENYEILYFVCRTCSRNLPHDRMASGYCEARRDFPAIDAQERRLVKLRERGKEGKSSD